jgi:hypothetical protein
VVVAVVCVWVVGVVVVVAVVAVVVGAVVVAVAVLAGVLLTGWHCWGASRLTALAPALRSRRSVPLIVLGRLETATTKLRLSDRTARQ